MFKGKWDKIIDVVVVGLGNAGGAAAIEAHDSGAKAKPVQD
jgi:succinate dehydrogenase/fumarate reductase flavoprotein subunit